jgi:hypothetical protein
LLFHERFTNDGQVEYRQNFLLISPTHVKEKRLTKIQKKGGRSMGQ